MAHDIAWICGVAWDDVRFPLAVRPGDTLRARSRCLSKRLSAKHPERGVVVSSTNSSISAMRLVFTCRSTNLIERRPGAAGMPTATARAPSRGTAARSAALPGSPPAAGHRRRAWRKRVAEALAYSSTGR